MYTLYKMLKYLQFYFYPNYNMPPVIFIKFQFQSFNFDIPYPYFVFKVNYT